MRVAPPISADGPERPGRDAPMIRMVLAMVAVTVITAAGLPLCRRALRHSNTQVHRINQ